MSFIFKPTKVLIDFDIREPGGRPANIPDGAADELMNLHYMDNVGQGYGLTPGEISVLLEHPRDVTPHMLRAIQQEVTAIIEKHLRLEEAAKHLDQAEFPIPTGE